MKLNNHIIVVGNNHHNTLGLVRSLGRGGYDVHCYLVDETITNSFLEKSKYIKEFKIFHSLDELLVFFRNDVKTDKLIPTLTTSDRLAEFLDNHYDELHSRLLLCNCADKQGGVSYWMAKDRQIKIAQKAGIIVPNSVDVNLKGNKRSIQGIHYPCILKPEKSSAASKENVRICHNEEQLEAALEEITPFCEDVIIQDYIQRDYEFLIMGVRSRKHDTTIIPGGLHKLRTCKKTKSLGMFAYAYTTPEIDKSIDIEAVKRFLEEIDYDGIFSVEFMIANGKAYFLEVNLRNDGTQFCFEGAGVNLPQLWIKASKGMDITSDNKSLEKKYCMVEVNYLKNIDWHHPLTALKEWWNSSLFALWDKKDWKPALYKLKYAGEKIKIAVVGGVNHHNTLSMVRCLGEAGYHVELICKGSGFGCAAKSKYVKRTFVYNDDEELIKILKVNYDDVRETYVVINCDDLSTHILDMHYDDLKERFVFFNAGWEGRITEYQDKQVQTALAKKVGCFVPQSIVYSGKGKVQFDYYPCLAKPQESINGGKKILICDSQEELDGKIEQFADGNTVLIQQFIMKNYEVVLLGMAWQGEVFIPGYIRKIRDNKGGTTYSEIHPICEMNSKLKAQSEALIKEMGYEGLFGIEFIHNDNGFYFIEANLRNDATCYALAKAGVNLPVAYVKAAKGEDVRELLTNSEVRQIRSMVELKDLKFVLKGKVSLLQWLKDLKEAECKFYYSKEDKKPLLYALLSIFMRVVPFNK